MQTREEPVLPVAPQSLRPIRSLDEAPPKPVNVLLKSDALQNGLATQTCVQCGINPAGKSTTRTFQWVPGWVYIGLALNILILMILYYAGRKRLNATLYLCSDCAAADAQGRRLAGLSIAGAIVGPIVLGIASAVLDLSGEATAFVVGAGIVAGVVGAIAAWRKTRPSVIHCRRIDAKAKTILLSASPEWQKVLARELPEALAG